MKSNFLPKTDFLKYNIMKPCLRTRRTTRFIRYYHDIKKGHIGLGSAIAYQSEDYPTKKRDRERPLKASAHRGDFQVLTRVSKMKSLSPPPFPLLPFCGGANFHQIGKTDIPFVFLFTAIFLFLLSSFIWPVPLQSAPHFISLRSFPLKEEGETEKAIIPFFFSEKKKIWGILFAPIGPFWRNGAVGRNRRTGNSHLSP